MSRDAEKAKKARGHSKSADVDTAVDCLVHCTRYRKVRSRRVESVVGAFRLLDTKNITFWKKVTRMNGAFCKKIFLLYDSLLNILANGKR